MGWVVQYGWTKEVVPETYNITLEGECTIRCFYHMKFTAISIILCQYWRLIKYWSEFEWNNEKGFKPCHWSNTNKLWKWMDGKVPGFYKLHTRSFLFNYFSYQLITGKDSFIRDIGALKRNFIQKFKYSASMSTLDWPDLMPDMHLIWQWHWHFPHNTFWKMCRNNGV